jgi:hypothetical protein
MGVDRYAHKFVGQTPYVYASNNPTTFIDINGDSTFLYNVDMDPMDPNAYTSFDGTGGNDFDVIQSVSYNDDGSIKYEGDSFVHENPTNTGSVFGSPARGISGLTGTGQLATLDGGDDPFFSLFTAGPFWKLAGGSVDDLASLGFAAGRTGKQGKFKDMLTDNTVAKYIKGWIKQELNSIKRGKRRSIRNPPGKQMAHERGREAAKGFDYKHSNLQDIDLHGLQHKYDNFGRKNKIRN